MRIDRSGEEIARDLMAEAERVWGADDAQNLKGEIETHAQHLAVIGKYALPLDNDEPDMLVAPYPEVEAE